jgi:cyclohexanecarboxylate-CoA ligase
MASPVTHALGFLYGVLMPLGRGLTAIYQDVWDASTMLELVERYRVSWTMAATPFLLDAVRAQRATPHDLSSLRYVVSGGAPIPSRLVTDVRSQLGAQLVAVFGMTENGAVTITGPDDPDDVVADSDGQPVPWMRVRVIGETGHAVAPDAVGRLQVRGAAQTIGYFQRPDLYRAATTDDGWFDTGDLARQRVSRTSCCAAGRTSRSPRWRTRCTTTHRSPRSLWSATRTSVSASACAPSSCPTGPRRP